MIFGFTGTRNGMSEDQKDTVRWNLRLGSEFHHGDCFGADVEAYGIALAMGLKIVCHPPENSTMRAFTASFDVIMPKQGYLQRNRAIVDACEILIATPEGYVEQERSGTWSTIRYARSRNKELLIIYPDGSIEHSKEWHK